MSHQEQQQQQQQRELSPAACFSSMCQLLEFLVKREAQHQQMQQPGGDMTQRTSVAWYEASPAKSIDPSFFSGSGSGAIALIRDCSCLPASGSDKGAAAAAVAATSSFELIRVSSSSSPSSSSSETITPSTGSSSSADGDVKLRAVVVDEEVFFSSPSKDRTVAVMFDEQFARGAASHADSIMRKRLMESKKKKMLPLMLMIQSEDDEQRDDGDADAEDSFYHQVSIVRLFIAPNNYQAWSWRKERFERRRTRSARSANGSASPRFLPLWRTEMDFNALIFSRLAKSPDSWAHRTWLMQKLFEHFSSCIVAGDDAAADDDDNHANSSSSNTSTSSFASMFLIDTVVLESQRFAARACSVYKRGYPAWEYRRAIWSMLLHHIVSVPSSPSPSSSSSSLVGRDWKLQLLLPALKSELHLRLQWIESRPADASAVSSFVELFRSVVAAALTLTQHGDDQSDNRSVVALLLQETLRAAWALSQRMIRQHCFISRSSCCSFSSSSSSAVQFIAPNLSHETIWFLRRGVVDLSSLLPSLVAVEGISSRGAGAAFLLHGSWTLSDEIEFVSTLAESHERASEILVAASRRSEGQRGGREEDEGESVVRMKLNRDDVSVADHGEYAALHMWQYLAWLLRRR